jgi:hypothetical protein
MMPDPSAGGRPDLIPVDQRADEIETEFWEQLNAVGIEAAIRELATALARAEWARDA